MLYHAISCYIPFSYSIGWFDKHDFKNNSLHAAWYSHIYIYHISNGLFLWIPHELVETLTAIGRNRPQFIPCLAWTSALLRRKRQTLPEKCRLMLQRWNILLFRCRETSLKQFGNRKRPVVVEHVFVLQQIQSCRSKFMNGGTVLVSLPRFWLVVTGVYHLINRWSHIPK